MAGQAPAATPFIEYRLRLIGDRLPDGKKDPNLQIRVDERTKNEVHIISNTGIFGADQKQISIQAKLDAYTFGLVVMYARDVHAKEPGFKFPPIRCYGPRKRRDGEKGIPKGLDCVIQVGKDQAGHCYITLLRKDPPHIKYIFRPSMWNELIDPNNNNQPLPLPEVSNWYSRSWAEVLAPLVTNVLADPDYVFDYRAEKEGNNNGGGGYNGGNRGNNNGGGYNGGGGNGGGNGGGSSAPADSGNGWDDDIPM